MTTSVSHGKLVTKVIRWSDDVLYYEYEVTTGWAFLGRDANPDSTIRISAVTTCPQWDSSIREPIIDLPSQEQVPAHLDETIILANNSELIAYHQAFVRTLLG